MVRAGCAMIAGVLELVHTGAGGRRRGRLRFAASIGASLYRYLLVTVADRNHPAFPRRPPWKSARRFGAPST